MSAREVIARALFETDRFDIRTAEWDDQYESVRNRFCEQADRLTAAGYRIIGPDEVAALQKALTKAEDGAGTLPAKEAVKLRPADWHALAAAIRSLGEGR